MYDHVLLPSDGSDAARAATEHAVAIAERFDATLHGLSVLVEGPYGALQRTDVREDAEAGAADALDRVERTAEDAGVGVRTATREGIPHEEILRYATDESVDLIVMGTVGRTGLDRVLVGSVAERVVREASVPVVTVRGVADEIVDPSTAESAAIEALEARGHDRPTVAEEPYRTGGSWIVPLESGEGTVHVHVDAATRDVRIARID